MGKPKQDEQFYILSDYEPLTYQYRFAGEYYGTSHETGWSSYVVLPQEKVEESTDERFFENMKEYLDATHGAPVRKVE